MAATSLGSAETMARRRANMGSDLSHTTRFVGSPVGILSLYVYLPVLLMSLNFYPVIGITVAAWFKGLRTAVALHRPVSCTEFYK
jgi:hypothetical protein